MSKPTDLTGLTEADAATADLRMLVLRGACDYIPEAVADEYVAEFGAELVPVPGAGHALLEDQPEAFRRTFTIGQLARALDDVGAGPDSPVRGAELLAPVIARIRS